MRAFSRSSKAMVAAGVMALALTACGSGGAAEPAETPAAGGTVDIENNLGTTTVPTNPESVIATDNRVFETLDAWGVELSAAPKRLVPAGISYRDDESVADLGSHREPDMEASVAAQPDLIINGQRFTQHGEKLAELNPEAAMIDLTPRDGEDYGAELKRQTTGLGQAFGKEAEAEQLNADFDAAVSAAKEAYDPEQTVLAVITSGGEINYAAPGDGRSLGVVYPMLGLTPAMEVDDTSSDHQGDDVSVEAIAQSNPDWILVMDRDAAVSGNSGEEYTPANELLKQSPALQNVEAVKQDRIIYMPEDTYTNEGIQTYTEFLNSVADTMGQG